MIKDLIPKLAVGIFFLLVCGWLIVPRFDVVSSQPMVVIASQNSAWQVGTQIKRGQIVETKEGEYIAFKIGDDVFLGIDERSRILPDRLFQTQRLMRFNRGRVEIQTESPVSIETNRTVNTIENARAVFINYDFDQMLTVAPVHGNVQTKIKGQNDERVVSTPINISEKNPVTYTNTTFSSTHGPSAPFHAWLKNQLSEK